MPLYIDYHQMEGDFSIEEVRGAHAADIENQLKYGVKFLQLWVNKNDHQLSEKTSLDLTTYHGRGFMSAEIESGHFIITGLSIRKLHLSNTLYYSIFPQFTFITLDGETDGLFASTIFGKGHKNSPFFLSTQLTQPLVTNITPEPGFKWNIGLSYAF